MIIDNHGCDAVRLGKKRQKPCLRNYCKYFVEILRMVVHIWMAENACCPNMHSIV